MANEDYREYHRRVAARLRCAAEHSTTRAIKAPLIAEAQQHERITRDETEIPAQSPPISSASSDKPQEKRKGRVRLPAPSNPNGTHSRGPRFCAD
jgi:hypothetical protein